MDYQALERKYKYAANITKTAQANGYTPKEVLCQICGKPITLAEVERGEVDYSKGKIKGSKDIFFHSKCFKNQWGVLNG